MALGLTCDLRLLPTADGGRTTPLKSAWRGLVWFGEVWTEQDTALWPDYGAPLPIGEELVYGCELRLVDASTETLAPGHDTRVELAFWAIEEPRPAMRLGATFEVREGRQYIGVGTVLEVVQP
jgi:hypothetical protein